MSVSVLVALDTKSYEILSRIIAQPAPRLNVMDLKALHAPARLATPAISLQNFAAELAIGFRVNPQSWPFAADPGQSVTCTFSRSCLICGFGRLSTKRVSAGRRAGWLPVSKFTPARKSAQIISRQ